MKIKNSIKIKKPLLNNSLCVYYYKDLKKSLEGVKEGNDSNRKNENESQEIISKKNNFLDSKTDLFSNQVVEEEKQDEKTNEHELIINKINSGNGKFLLEKF